MAEYIYVDGIKVKLKVTIGRRLSYRASVASNELLCCVPRGLSARSVNEFVASTVQKKREEEVFNVYKNGGFMYLFGEKLPVKMCEWEEKKTKFLPLEGTMYIAVAEKEKYPIDAIARRFYVKTLTKRIAERMPVMETYVGLHCISWKVSSYHAAWGKCNNKEKTITFSPDLATQKPEFIDTVIIHELGHLLYPNHGEEFQKYMDKFAPDHRKILRNALK